MSHNDYDYTFKFILIGDTCTGKTTIANSYIRLEKIIITNSPTLGIDFATRIISLANGKRIKLICWDTAGQEKYRSIISNYYKDICGVLLVYDITNRRSFNNLEYWLAETRKHNICRDHKHPILLIGTKQDLESKRRVDTQEGLTFASRHGLFFVETNALNPTSLDNIMETFLTTIYHLALTTSSCRGIKKNSSNSNSLEIDLDDSKDKKKDCCPFG